MADDGSKSADDNRPGGNLNGSELGNLDISFEDVGEGVEEIMRNVQNEEVQSEPSCAAAAEACKKTDDDDGLDKTSCSKGATGDSVPEDYILGTLIVRVVAARDLEPAAQPSNALGSFFFGAADVKTSSSRKSSRNGLGSANPYASVRFGNTTQRTTEVFETTDPVWPRTEAMYMDVTHAASTVPSQEKADDDDANVGLKKGDAAVKGNAASASKKGLEVKRGSSDVTLTSEGTPEPPKKPILTVALFHASEIGKLHRFPTKKVLQGDSDDQFLGMTSIDLTHLLTGKVSSVDEWLPLTGANKQHSSRRSRVRVVCEYDPSDSAPRAGDMVRFTDFCHHTDLYPLYHGRKYKVVDSADGDMVKLEHETPEGWVTTFQVHRYMLICEERHHSTVELYQDELITMTERIANSAMVGAVQESVDRVAEDGLLDVGADVVRGARGLLQRWWEGGLETTVRDLTVATNWDGQHGIRNTTADSLDTTASLDEMPSPPVALPSESTDSSEVFADKGSALPNMPPCPITGEPMIDPVVAADGHTYERSAIARWLSTSNKSPLTGSVLPHKDLVPNYMLLSSLASSGTVHTKNEQQPEENEEKLEENEEKVEEDKTKL